MHRNIRVISFVGVAIALLVGTGMYLGVDFSSATARSHRPLQEKVVSISTLDQRPRIVFRNTEVGAAYGLVSVVGLTDAGGPRAFTDVACDRVYARADTTLCLRTKRRTTTEFEAEQLDLSWRITRSWALSGTPSRARVSPDGTLLASTVFVAAHSYRQVGFTTATDIRTSKGHDFGNLESFALTVDGHRTRPADRNIWGVTFAADDNTFYATAAIGGKTYLMRGDLRARTLTSIRTGAECPSLSPDGSHVAYKKNFGVTTPHWSIAVLNLADGTEQVLTSEQRSVDDQVEWLDDSTLLYGLPRPKEAGVSDVWSIGTTGKAKPRVFIAHTWSPSVVRS